MARYAFNLQFLAVSPACSNDEFLDVQKRERENPLF